MIISVTTGFPRDIDRDCKDRDGINVRNIVVLIVLLIVLLIVNLILDISDIQGCFTFKSKRAFNYRLSLIRRTDNIRIV
jgi:hypothetical protein